MNLALYTVWRPKNIIIMIIFTMLINAVLFMGLPALTRMADRERSNKRETQYMITSREPPKPREDSKEKRLRRKELRQIPRPKMAPSSQRNSDTPRFAFDRSSDGVDGLAVDVRSAEGMNIDVADITFSIDDVDAPPRVIRAPPVNYPYKAMSKGVTGRVFVHIRIGVDGRATNIKAKRAEPPEVLDVFREEAEKAVGRYRFEPARLGGEAVPVWATQPINFDLY